MIGVNERFACPVPWCAGTVWDHGGDGIAGPEDWLHSSARLPLAGTLWAVRSSVGSGAAVWSVYVAGNESAVGTEVPAAEQLVTTLEDAARALRQLARGAGDSG